MSWLGALAAKTENLLNKVDQAAGQALQQTSFERTDSSSQLSSQWQLSNENTTTGYSPYLSQTSEKRQPYQTSTVVGQASKPAKKDEDSELIKFLNDPQPLSTRISNPANTPVRNTVVVGEAKTPNIPQNKANHSIDSLNDNDVSQASSLMEENHLLKNEIQSLNRELQSIISRMQVNQEEMNKTTKELEKQSKQLLRSEQTVRELQDRESDLLKTIEAKETQTSLLRLRLEEADGNLKLQKMKVNDLISENDRILQDHSMSTGVQSYALETLQEKIQGAEDSLRRELDNFSKQEAELKQKLLELESDKQNLLVEVSNLQKNLSREKASSGDTANQLKSARSQMENAKQELVHYKEKATRILQSKDRLIATLKEGSLNNVDGSGASEPIIHSSEMDSLRQERDILREDYHSSQIALENLRAEISDLESQMQQDNESMKEQMRLLEDQMELEKRRREDAESENNKQKQELKFIHEDILKQKSAFQMRLQDREAEIQRLRSQLTTKSLNMTSQEELENRLHTLTESLIQKQMALESLSTEKNSLLLQLERTEKQYREAESSALRSSSTTVHFNNSDDDVRPRFSTFMKESPLDGNVTRKVKMAANTIDRFSISLGIFLRRYPIARVFVIIYMILLHLWVMVVLLTYQPEVHASDFAPHGS